MIKPSALSVFSSGNNFKKNINTSPKIDWKFTGAEKSPKTQKALQSLMDSLHSIIRYDGVPDSVLKKTEALSNKKSLFKNASVFRENL